uniref:Uncharacterized protein n=1 Tax=Meloidogyne enterolobii TaxID=390850 RepID=A0A6V7W4N4_MELEN|nr:unnamed protein product [Meloidogyne enterolobii]
MILNFFLISTQIIPEEKLVSTFKDVQVWILIWILRKALNVVKITNNSD